MVLGHSGCWKFDVRAEVREQALQLFAVGGREAGDYGSGKAIRACGVLVVAVLRV
jgi:hypothetical protein